MPTATDVREQVVELAREFAREKIEPFAAEWDRTSHFPRDVIDELGKLGFLGMCTPEEYEGMGLDTITYLMVLEEISAADSALAVSIGIHNAIPSTMLVKHGTREQKERWLKPMARGELLAGFALSEAEAGSDAASLRSQAIKDGKHWVLNGAKAWATNAGTADLMMIMVRTDTPNARRGAKGISTFIVPTDSKGYKPAKPEDKMGLRASNTAGIELNDLRLPADQMLGDEGMGFVYAMEGLDAGRLGIGAQGVGIARKALELSLKYCAERKQFGKAIADFQSVQFQIARAATEVEAARLMVYNAARLRDAGSPFLKEAAMCKIFSSEVAEHVSSLAVNLFGGYGFVKDYPVEKFFRDAKIGQIYEGTSNLQLQTIAKQILG